MVTGSTMGRESGRGASFSLMARIADPLTVVAVVAILAALMLNKVGPMMHCPQAHKTSSTVIALSVSELPVCSKVLVVRYAQLCHYKL
jgi:hypothetical protein